MKRLFASVAIIDVALLLLPTHWMGRILEIGFASTLALATALVWLVLRFNDEEV